MSARPIRGICRVCGERAKTHAGTLCKVHEAERMAELKIIRAQRTAEANRQRWAEWREQGIDPTHGGEAAAKRAQTIAVSNRERPRKRKQR